MGDPANPTWLDRMTYAVEDSAIKMFDDSNTMDQIIDGWVGAGIITHDVYTWNALTSRAQKNGVDLAHSSMFNLYRALIDADEAVMIRIDGTPTAGAWWSGSYHQIVGAGYDVANHDVYYADPNNRGSGDATANWGFPYFLASALPVGDAYYDVGVMNADGTFSSGAYVGAGFVRFDAFFISAPEPSMLDLISACLFAWLAVHVLRARARSQARH
jgi:hypothetical protein